MWLRHQKVCLTEMKYLHDTKNVSLTHFRDTTICMSYNTISMGNVQKSTSKSRNLGKTYNLVSRLSKRHFQTSILTQSQLRMAENDAIFFGPFRELLPTCRRVTVAAGEFELESPLFDPKKTPKNTQNFLKKNGINNKKCLRHFLLLMHDFYKFAPQIYKNHIVLFKEIGRRPLISLKRIMRHT